MVSIVIPTLNSAATIGACLDAVLAQDLCQLVELQDFFLVVSLAGFNHGLCFFVSKAAVALDNGLYDARVLHFGLVVHLARDGLEAILDELLANSVRLVTVYAAT